MTSLESTRRRFLTTMTTGALVAALPVARAAAADKPESDRRWKGYARASVVDACGSPGSANKSGEIVSLEGDNGQPSHPRERQ